MLIKITAILLSSVDYSTLSTSKEKIMGVIHKDKLAMNTINKCPNQTLLAVFHFLFS